MRKKEFCFYEFLDATSLSIFLWVLLLYKAMPTNALERSCTSVCFES